MRQQFQDIRFREETLRVINDANAIIDDYAAQGFRLTLRQLYYQFVSRDWLANTERNYKRLGEIVSNGRLAGLIDWDAIEDRTRNLRTNSHWSTPAHIIRAAESSFAIDKWRYQPNRIEVWVEKDALVGVIERPCRTLDVPFFACRGYTSQSEMFEASSRLLKYLDAGQDVYILHLGDHDPSGIDMTRDIESRLAMFLEDGYASVNRLALNWHQIERYRPPPNPAKVTDSRFAAYEANYGVSSWELDALEPTVIASLVEDNILALRDDDLWSEAVAEEVAHRHTLEQAAARWGEIETLIRG